MPLNPNIILQAGRGVTPVNRRDPMREALGAQRIQSNQRNALRQERQDKRQEGLDARATETYDRENEQRQFYELAVAAKSDPQAWAQMGEFLASKKPGARLPEWSPEVADGYLNQLVEKKLGFEKYAARQDRQAATAATAAQREQAQANADRAYGLSLRKQNWQETKPASGGVNITGYDEEGRPLISVGGSGQRAPSGGLAYVKPTNKVAGDAQKDLQGGWETITRLRRIKDLYKADYLTYQGSARNAIAVAADKAGMSTKAQRSFLGKRRKFMQNVNREYNSYRKEITGAAGAEKELRDLKKATIADDLSPAQFESSFEEYTAEVMRSMRVKQILLRQGVRVGDKAFGEAFDQMFLGGHDDDIAVRAQELHDQGLSREEGIAQLKTEGYL